MADPGEKSDELELKKRARRRLVGAVAFATLAAVVLPMVMDESPPAAGHDIEIRIPSPEQPGPGPAPAKAEPGAPLPAAAPLPAPAAEMPAAVAVPAKESPKPQVKAAEPPKPAEPAKAAEAPRAAEPPRVVAKSEPAGDAKRALAILDGQAVAGAHVVLIGAFANPGNVKILQTKLGQLGIKTYTEMLDSPQGRKTRLRAGPFASKDAADKALEKMKRIGVNGVVAPKS